MSRRGRRAGARDTTAVHVLVVTAVFAGGLGAFLLDWVAVAGALGLACVLYAGWRIALTVRDDIREGAEMVRDAEVARRRRGRARARVAARRRRPGPSETKGEVPPVRSWEERRGTDLPPDSRNLNL